MIHCYEMNYIRSLSRRPQTQHHHHHRRHRRRRRHRHQYKWISHVLQTATMTKIEKKLTD